MIRKTLIDYYAELGNDVIPCMLVIFAALLFALMVHVRALGFRHRIALLPISFLPLVVAIFQGANLYRSALLNELAPTPDTSLVSGLTCGLTTHWDTLLVYPMLGSAGTFLLLIVTTLLLLSKAAEPGRHWTTDLSSGRQDLSGEEP